MSQIGSDYMLIIDLTTTMTSELQVTHETTETQRD